MTNHAALPRKQGEEEEGSNKIKPAKKNKAPGAQLLRAAARDGMPLGLSVMLTSGVGRAEAHALECLYVVDVNT